MDHGITLCTVGEFPPDELLGPLNEAEQQHAPDVLYLAGNDEYLRAGQRVSIVGSRRASPDSIRRARKLARALVERNITVVSGLAAGIDTAAHSAAIEFGGRTVAVLGTPVDQAYPKSNERLLPTDHFVACRCVAVSGWDATSTSEFPDEESNHGTTVRRDRRRNWRRA